MKQLISVCLVVMLGAVRTHAGPTEAAIMAIMRLSDQPSYSWVATISDDARTYDIQGKTMQGGFTQVKMPVINSVRRQLGRSVTDTDVELIFRGNVACVIQTEDGWKRPDELPGAEFSEAESPHLPATTGHAPLLGTRSSVGGSMRGGLGPRSSRSGIDGPDRGYSNLQLAISHPHEELGVIVGSHGELAVDGDMVTGTLTELGAQLLLVRDGQSAITPLRAAGTFRIWLRDGMVTKYQVRLEGILRVEVSSGHRQINVHQVTDTILKDIGTTKFEVPPQVRAKLGA